MISMITTVVNEPSDQAYMIWVYEEFRRLMFAAAQKYSANPADQEDIVQESLIHLMGKISLLRTFERCVLAAYIVSTVRNVSINNLKRQGRYVKGDKEAQNILQEGSYSGDEVVNQIYRKDQLNLIWGKLSEEERLLLRARYFLGYSDQEIGRLLNYRADNVRMKLTRARRKAMKLMKEQEDEYDQARTAAGSL